MSQEHHYLKTETEYYQAIERGQKKFEMRIDDRGYKVGDMVYLQEVVKGNPTGRNLPPVEIRYILSGAKYGLKEGWCIFNW